MRSTTISSASSRSLGLLRTLGLCACLAALALSSTASAQDPSLAGARQGLASYDLEGPTTLAALRDLGPVVAHGGAPAAEARYLRAIAGTDLFTLSIALGDDALAARLADALGVAPRDVEAHLRAELGSARTGVFRRSVGDELRLLDLAMAFERQDLGALLAGRGPRADALVVLSLAEAVRSGADLAPVTGRGVPAFAADPEASSIAWAIQTATSASTRATSVAALGDPWLARLTERLAAARVGLAAVELRPRVALPETLVSATEEASGARADVVFAVDTAVVSFGCAPLVTLPDGATPSTRTLSPTGHCAALPELTRVALGPLPAVTRSVEALVSAVRGADLATATSVVVAPAPRTPLHVLARVFLSLASAGVPATHVALRATDGSLVITPIRLVREADLGPVDLRVHLRLGGYVIGRGRGRDVSIPRARGAAGLQYDRAALALALRERPPTSVAIDGMASVDATQVVLTAELLAGAGASVTLVLP